MLEINNTSKFLVKKNIRGVLNLSEYLMTNQCIINNWSYFMDVIVDDFKDLK